MKHIGAETLDEYSTSGKLKKGDFRIRQKSRTLQFGFLSVWQD
jgi:hypothetical protein